MSQPITRSRVYTGLFFFTVLIVIPYLIGGVSGIVVGFVSVVLFAAVVGLVKQIWRIPFLSHLQTQSPTSSLILKAFVIAIIMVALFIIILTATIPPTSWLPIAD